MIPRKPRPGSIFGVPALLAAISLIGLLIGLLGDGWYDIVAGAAVAVPVAVILWSLVRARAGRWDMRP